MHGYEGWFSTHWVGGEGGATRHFASLEAHMFDWVLDWEGFIGRVFMVVIVVVAVVCVFVLCELRGGGAQERT